MDFGFNVLSLLHTIPRVADLFVGIVAKMKGGVDFDRFLKGD